MPPTESTRPWMQIWRDWLDALPLRDEPLEPEMSPQAFGAVTTPRAAPRPDLRASDQPKSLPATDAQPPAA